MRTECEHRSEVSAAGWIVSLVVVTVGLTTCLACAVKVHEVSQARVAETRARVECENTMDPGECFADRMAGEVDND